VSRPSLRILVFDLPPLLRDLVVRALEEHDDMCVAAAAGELSVAVEASRPDAVIVAADAGVLAQESRDWLAARARPPVLGLGVRDGRAILYELEPRGTEVGAVAPSALAALIRTSLGRTVGV
jgi:hypothetical protein